MKIARMADVDFAGIIKGKKYTPSPAAWDDVMSPMSRRVPSAFEAAPATDASIASPAAWEDQVFYFLLVDRFSDGKEVGCHDNDGQIVIGNGTPMFSLDKAGNIPYNTWASNGQGWKGGNLKGVTSKLGYLKRMGITALWISPIFKQVAFAETYHGYGIQNFMAIDPHFGTEQDLIELVEKAHSLGIYVVLDIIINHTGNVFTYKPNRYLGTRDDGTTYYDPRWDGHPYDVAGFNDASGRPTVLFQANATTNPDEAIFPQELQNPTTFTRKGHINNWDYYPEFLEGDFCDLKDVYHGSGPDDFYTPSKALQTLVEAYKYWIATADVDGFRIDTVKHMEIGASRYFVSAIHEFAQTLGKERFFLMGEITGGRERAAETLKKTGIDAALGIDDIPDKLEYVVKGYRNPADYFNLFRNSKLVGDTSPTWLRDTVVTVFDDHDQVRKGNGKARFCAKEEGWRVLLNVLALNALTLGIPCVYYGSEQYFNGHATDEKRDGNDVFLRESMFGGNYGALESSGYHFFNEESRAYIEFAKILEVRRREIALRRGRQYLREISGNGVNFGLPQMVGNEIRSVVPWSRILDEQEIVAAINTDYNNARTAWVTVDNGLNKLGRAFTCLYSTDSSQIGSQVTVAALNGKAVQLTVPAAGCAIWKAV